MTTLIQLIVVYSLPFSELIKTLMTRGFKTNFVEYLYDIEYRLNKIIIKPCTISLTHYMS